MSAPVNYDELFVALETCGEPGQAAIAEIRRLHAAVGSMGYMHARRDVFGDEAVSFVAASVLGLDVPKHVVGGKRSSRSCCGPSRLACANDAT